jgi:hypothetical protein
MTTKTKRTESATDQTEDSVTHEEMVEFTAEAMAPLLAGIRQNEIAIEALKASRAAS